MSTPFADPAYLAARCGLPGDAEAVNKAQQIAQLLASHAITPLYAGNQLITPAGNVGYGYGGIDWICLGVSDIDQPFTMPAGHTVIGRVTLPLSPVGNGADVTVSLCADSGGSPGTVITSVTVPAAHLLQLAAPSGLPGNPLATAQSNTLRMGDMTTATWASPVSGAGSPSLPSVTQSGNYMVQAGGQAGSMYVTSVYTAGWTGGTSPGTVLPQPPLPQVSDGGVLIATSDTLVYASGVTGTPVSEAWTTDVWAAGWSPSSGQVQAWSAQASLPQAVLGAAGAFDPGSDTVYIIGGENSSSAVVQNVYYATIANGQLGAWQSGPPLPGPRQEHLAAVVNGWLIVAGGFAISTPLTDTWLAPVRADGSLGPWVRGPSMQTGVTCSDCYAVTSSGILVLGGVTTGGASNVAQSLTVTADGPGQWQSQQLNPATAGAVADSPDSPAAAYSLGAGSWQALVINPSSGQYSSGVLSSVPVISVPLPATGLTGGSTYHLLLHQAGGDAADYVQAAVDPGALATAAQTRPNSGGSWTGLTNTYSLFAGVFDQTPGGPPLHLWQDAGARVVTLVWAGGYGELLGAIETTSFPAGSPEAVLCAVTEVVYNGTGLPYGITVLA